MPTPPRLLMLWLSTPATPYHTVPHHTAPLRPAACRLSTVRRADVIAVVEGGRVVEQGSHSELVELEGGVYQRLVSASELGEGGEGSYWVETGVSSSSSSDEEELAAAETQEAAAAADAASAAVASAS